MQSLLILGRQPEIGLAELESLYGGDKLRSISNNSVIVDVDPCLLAFDRLGGSIKFAKVLAELNAADWDRAISYLTEQGPEHSKSMPEGKMQLGISAYGFNYSSKQVLSAAIKLKESIRATGRSVRVIPNNDPALSSAQVIHNNLTGERGWEILLIKSGSNVVIAQTLKVQNIQAYARRDQKRPYRDAKVGMLPPKLAQTIINLAVGLLPEESRHSVCEIPPDQPIPKQHYNDALLLDPFCGSGVIIQEAALMGYNCIGSDIDPLMVSFANNNLKWLSNQASLGLNPAVKTIITQADATKNKWQQSPTFVASEIYLGKAFSRVPNQNDLENSLKTCNDILRDFLINLAPQIKSSTRLCLAVPAWILGGGHITHLPLLDSIGVIGYNRVSFSSSQDDQLIYHRPEQIVARELLVLTKQ